MKLEEPRTNPKRTRKAQEAPAQSHSKTRQLVTGQQERNFATIP